MDIFSYFPSRIEGSDEKVLDKGDVDELNICGDGKIARDICIVKSDDPNIEGLRSAGDVYDDYDGESNNENDHREEESDYEKEVEGVG